MYPKRKYNLIFNEWFGIHKSFMSDEELSEIKDAIETWMKIKNDI